MQVETEIRMRSSLCAFPFVLSLSLHTTKQNIIVVLFLVLDFNWHSISGSSAEMSRFWVALSLTGRVISGSQSWVALRTVSENKSSSGELYASSKQWRTSHNPLHIKHHSAVLCAGTSEINVLSLDFKLPVPFTQRRKPAKRRYLLGDRDHPTRKFDNAESSKHKNIYSPENWHQLSLQSKPRAREAQDLCPSAERQQHLPPSQPPSKQWGAEYSSKWPGLNGQLQHTDLTLK